MLRSLSILASFSLTSQESLRALTLNPEPSSTALPYFECRRACTPDSPGCDNARLT